MPCLVPHEDQVNLMIEWKQRQRDGDEESAKSREGSPPSLDNIWHTELFRISIIRINVFLMSVCTPSPGWSILGLNEY